MISKNTIRIIFDDLPAAVGAVREKEGQHPEGMIGTEVKQGLIRVIRALRPAKRGAYKITPLTGFIEPEDALNFIRSL